MYQNLHIWVGTSRGPTRLLGSDVGPPTKAIISPSPLIVKANTHVICQCTLSIPKVHPKTTFLPQKRFSKTTFLPESSYQHFREPKVFLPLGQKTLSVPRKIGLKTLLLTSTFAHEAVTDFRRHGLRRVVVPLITHQFCSTRNTLQDQWMVITGGKPHSWTKCVKGSLRLTHPKT